MEDDTRQMTESTTLVSELDLILHQDDDATMFESTTDVPEATTMADVDVLAIEPAGADVQSVEGMWLETSFKQKSNFMLVPISRRMQY